MPDVITLFADRIDESVREKLCPRKFKRTLVCSLDRIDQHDAENSKYRSQSHSDNELNKSYALF